jgi:glycosyltransferase involved in cell wall biosynthesis
MVLPSVVDRRGKMEGIPVALMEAMSMEVPVISTRISGIPELVIDGQTGLLVPEKDPAALADAMARLLDDEPLRQRLGRDARQHIERHFHLADNLNRLRALLKEACDATPEPA